MARWQRGGRTHGYRTSYPSADARFGGRGGWRTRGSIQGEAQIASFKLDINDIQIQNAMDTLDREMPHVILEVLEESLNEVKDTIFDNLMGMSVVGGSAQEKIAKSIKVINTGERVRIFSSPYPGGVTGSRGVSLAQLYIEGTPAFMYDFDIDVNKPNSKVRIGSSKIWESKTGKLSDRFDPRKHPLHPGFGDWHPNERKTYDWVKESEEYIMDNFEYDLRTMIDRIYGGGGH